MKKKEKTELEPQYYMSAINTPVLNYRVYYMNKKEKVGYFLIAFIIGAVIGYLFYGGLAKDSYGNATLLTYILNVIVMCGVGCIAGKMFLPIRTNQIIQKRTRDLSRQFRDMLDGLTTSLGAGNNIPDSFLNVYNDLKVQYDNDAYIINELRVINSSMQNGIAIEDVIYDFGRRSGIEDILSFADVFKISYRQGGNIGEIIRDTHEVLSEKMEIREEIETMVSSNKTDTLFMIVVPVFLIAFIKISSPDFAARFATPVGIASTTIGVICFVVAYYMSSKLLDIKV